MEGGAGERKGRERESIEGGRGGGGRERGWREGEGVEGGRGGGEREMGGEWRDDDRREIGGKK